MKKDRFPEIKTARLLLRNLKPSDWKVISYLRSDEKVNKFVQRPSAESKEKALAFISKITTGVSKKEIYYWAICEKDKDVLIGSICLWNLSKDRKTAEVGYDLSPVFQKKGIMNESLQCILDFGFNNLNLMCVVAYTQVNNSSSVQLLERNGFVLNMKKKDPQNVENRFFEYRR